jgi:Mg2+ and Co2+ transporter CorA
MGRTDFDLRHRVVWDDRVLSSRITWRRGLRVRRGSVGSGPGVGFTLHWVRFDGGRLVVRPVRVRLGSEGVQTVHRGRLFVPLRLDPRATPRMALVAVLRTLTQGKLEALEQLDRAVGALETARAEHAHRGWEEAAFRLRRAAVTLRRVVGLERLTVYGLIAAQARRAPDAGLLAVYDELVRLGEGVDACRDLLNGAVDAHFSSLSARLNEVVKTLTVLTTGFLPISIVAALYGMNLRYLPAADHPWGFWGLVAVMAVAEAGLLVYFRRRRWL